MASFSDRVKELRRFEIFSQRLIECRKAKNVMEEYVAGYLGMETDVYLKYEAAFYSPSIEVNNL